MNVIDMNWFINMVKNVTTERKRGGEWKRESLHVLSESNQMRCVFLHGILLKLMNIIYLFKTLVEFSACTN